ncbi:hypothetical protein GCM10023189_47560 [Nibrella saemangeumensis]|uniref:Translocation and assembly module TamB C-terminal domain-containing protein n=1 Tax=Nibrella saemangeumensis TaxID=1084526 RepID=A0ABP8NGM1_9BACT
MKRFFLTALYVILALLFLVAGFLGFVAVTPLGQQFVTRQVNRYLAKKLKTPFSIGSITYRLPDWIALDNVYFETPQGDTLLYGRRMYVNVDMMGLLQNRVAINDLQLDNIRLYLKRTLPDTTYNFQFLIDAFDTGDTTTVRDTSAAPLDLSLTLVGFNNVRIRYHDDVVGMDSNFFLDSLRARFNEVNLQKSRYRLDSVRVYGLNATARMYEGVGTSEETTTPSSDTLDLALGNWKLNKVWWDFRTDGSGFETKGKVDRLDMTSDYFYLAGQKVGIRSLYMANADISALQEKQARTAAPPNRESPEAEDAGWNVKIGQVRLDNNRLRYDDQNQRAQPAGIDYAHLDMSDFSVMGQGIYYSPEQIYGKIRQGQFREKSGLVLQRLDADFMYSDTMTALTRFYLKTPGTLLRDKMVIRYDSLAQLSNPSSRVVVNMNLRQSSVAVADILRLMPSLADTPPFAGNRNAVFRINARAVGTTASLNIPTFDMATLSDTRIRANGQLRNVTDPNRLVMNITVTEAKTNRADINKLIPPNTLPDSFSLPPAMRLTGRIQGQLDNLDLDTRLQTAWGNATYDGSLRGFYTGKGQAYNGTLTLASLDAGKFLQNPQQYGPISGRATFNGRGLDPNTMSTTFDVNITEATLNGYRYQRLNAEGQLVQGNLTVRGGLDDPNAQINLNTEVGLKQEYPSIEGEINIQKLDLAALKLYEKPLSLNGVFTVDFESTNPTAPEGKLQARNASVTLEGKTYPIDSLYLVADTDQNRKILMARVPFGEIALNGEFQYTQLADIFIGEFSRYFKIPDLTYNPVQPPYSANIELKAYQHPLLQAFVPGLTRMDTVRLDGYIDNIRDTTFAANIRTGVIEYDTTVVQGATMSLVAVNNRLNIDGKINSVQNQSMKLNETRLTGTAANNQLQFSAVTKDTTGKDRHGLTGELAIVENNYRLSLNRNGLLTNYRTWDADTSGFVQYGKDGILAQQFRIRSGQQTLTLNSVQPQPNAPLRVEARNIDLSDMASLVNQDTTMVGGILNGDVIARDITTKPVFTGDVRVDSLEVMQKPIGTLTAKMTNTPDDRIQVAANLSGTYNQAEVTGFYNPASEKAPLDFRVNLQRLDARTIEAFSFGELRQAKGQLNGQFTVTGSPDAPRMNGAINFDSVAFNIAQLNTTYRIDKETLQMNGQTIAFQDFALTDTLGRTLITNGTVTLKTIPDVNYDLRVRADKFLVLNAARKDNDYVYGNAAITGNMRITGSGSNPSIVGTVRLEDNSKVTAVLPDESMDVNEARQTVIFIEPGDTLALQKYLTRPRPDTTQAKLSFDNVTNTNISLNLEATDRSEMTIVVDELNGDYLRVRGNARLNVVMSASGDVNVYGRYDVTEGEYDMTYQVLKRQFKLQKGSYINFSGDPMRADVNITAVYETLATPADLIANELPRPLPEARQKIPFNVLLKMSGNLAKPDIKFDIVVPEKSFVSTGEVVRTVNDKLTLLRQDESQLNKQVFALLVLNGFITENSSSFFSGSGEGGGAENLARNSVSKLLSEQLERMASNVLKGFNVDFDLMSSNSYVGTGSSSPATRTDLNVGLSRSFMQGRLSVAVGRNFVLQNNTAIGRNPSELFDNVSVNYNLTRDGRYMVRAYRNNAYQAILEGFVIETGVGFVITIDYNTLRQLFGKGAESEL